uniref:Stress-response A/B barrel domain-containing protein n=1 Tax=OCS116 cluster bacterium TaxID=2030921 RepID=A0A2A4YWE2_9PROT
MSKKIKHCVYMQFKPQYSVAERTAIMQRLADLKPIMNGFLSIEFGENLDFENKSDCNAGFVIDFASEADLQNYASHPEHQKIGSQLVEMSVGGADGIIVFDLAVE